MTFDEEQAKKVVLSNMMSVSLSAEEVKKIAEEYCKIIDEELAAIHHKKKQQSSDAESVE